MDCVETYDVLGVKERNVSKCWILTINSISHLRTQTVKITLLRSSS